MKNLLPFLFLAIILGSCKKGSDDPTPAIQPQTATLYATWEWESETLVSVFKDGRPTKTESKTVLPKSVYVTYSLNGYMFATINDVAQTRVAYTADTPLELGVPVTSTNKGFTVTKTITELTSTHMTLVEVDEDASAKYTTTDTYKR